MFVENILHSGKSNGKTTAAARDLHERRMRAYGQLLNTELLQEARKNLEKIQKGNVDSGPLTPKDVYTKAWEGKKPNKQMSTIIKSLKDEGRKLELLWKASTKGTIYLEQQRSFRPTALQGLGINDQIPSLMLLAALTVCRIMVRSLRHMTYLRNAGSLLKTFQVYCQEHQSILALLWKSTVTSP